MVVEQILIAILGCPEQIHIAWGIWKIQLAIFIYINLINMQYYF